jgi:hypothetical protein
MARFCSGEFSQETKRQLKAEQASGGGVITSLALCEKCGRHVLPENKAGEWVPITHNVPLAARPYKSGGGKR